MKNSFLNRYVVFYLGVVILLLNACCWGNNDEIPAQCVDSLDSMGLSLEWQDTFPVYTHENAWFSDILPPVVFDTFLVYQRPASDKYKATLVKREIHSKELVMHKEIDILKTTNSFHYNNKVFFVDGLDINGIDLNNFETENYFTFNEVNAFPFSNIHRSGNEFLLVVDNNFSMDTGITQDIISIHTETKEKKRLFSSSFYKNGPIIKLLYPKLWINQQETDTLLFFVKKHVINTFEKNIIAFSVDDNMEKYSIDIQSKSVYSVNVFIDHLLVYRLRYNNQNDWELALSCYNIQSGDLEWEKTEGFDNALINMKIAFNSMDNSLLLFYYNFGQGKVKEIDLNSGQEISSFDKITIVENSDIDVYNGDVFYSFGNILMSNNLITGCITRFMAFYDSDYPNQEFMGQFLNESNKVIYLSSRHRLLGVKIKD